MVETAQKVNIFMLWLTVATSHHCTGVHLIVQIYEIQTPREAEIMIELGVDHVGSVLLEMQAWKSSDLKSTVELVQSAGRKSSLIPLFGSVDAISEAIDYYQPDIIHFCETLPKKMNAGAALDQLLERQATIRDRYPGIDLMRSVPIGCSGQGNIFPSLAFAKAFEPLSDWFLTDTLLSADNSFTNDQQPVNGFVGITGKTCDWAIAAELVVNSAIPVILAGGIGPHNVATAISCVKPAGIDSCTLTNRMDDGGKARRFQKDTEKVTTLIQRARGVLNPDALRLSQSS